ncbi:cytochrome P450 monooxygenase pc-1 [Lentinula aff. detonsa]|nr:cytochrome P450 monooxygenase pc-1 [Lentinula aff. detonsa]
MYLTPGFHFVLKSLPVLLGYPATIACVLRIGFSQFGVVLPRWTLMLAAIFSLPCLAIFQYALKQLNQRRRATALGCQLIPKAKFKWPGNIDFISILDDSFKNGYLVDAISELLQSYGTVFNMNILWEDYIFTDNPEYMRIMLATRFHNYEKGMRFQDCMHSFLGTGVFNSDGEMWLFHRTMTRPFFNRIRIRDFEIFHRHSELMIANIKKRMEEGYAIDFQDVISRFTLDVATEFLFGHCMNALAATLPYPQNVPPSQIPVSDLSQSSAVSEFSAAFRQVQEIAIERQTIGWMWPLAEMWEDKSKRPMQIIHQYIEPIVHEAIIHAAVTPENKEISEDETFLSHLAKSVSDPVIIRDEILNILLAGRDTIACTLTFTMYFLARHPDVLSKLRREICSTIGAVSEPTLESIQGMPYLRAVINEVLRLYPPVPIDTRESIHDDIWPSPDPTQKPFYIPARTTADYSFLFMHRRKDLWGPDAEEFDPDRFLDERVQKYQLRNPFQFLPFNAGPRICLGQQFAYNEMSYILIKLLQSFSEITLDMEALDAKSHPPKEWANCPGRKGKEIILPKMHLTIYVAGGLWIRMGG